MPKPAGNDLIAAGVRWRPGLAAGRVRLRARSAREVKNVSHRRSQVPRLGLPAT